MKRSLLVLGLLVLVSSLGACSSMCGGNRSTASESSDSSTQYKPTGGIVRPL